MPQLPKTEQIQCSQQSQVGSRAERLEPDGLVICRGYGKFERVAALVPYTAVVAGNHTKPATARRQIAIERLSLIACVLPVAIPAFQLDAKAHLLRYYEAECGVVDLQNRLPQAFPMG